MLLQLCYCSLFLSDLLLVLLKVLVVTLCVLLGYHTNRCYELLLFALALYIPWFLYCWLLNLVFHYTVFHVPVSLRAHWALAGFTWLQYLFLIRLKWYLFLLLLTNKMIYAFINYSFCICHLIIRNTSHLICHYSMKSSFFLMRENLKKYLSDILVQVVPYCFYSTRMLVHELG